MYRTPREVWLGLAKNAKEGLASRRMIGPMTLILLGGQVLPLVLLVLAFVAWPVPWHTWQPALALFATAASYFPRMASVVRFRQSLLGAVLHPVGVFLLVAIQWFAFLRDGLGRPSTWKGRAYSAPVGMSEVPADGEIELLGWVKPTN
jgi:hypothetical protein